MSELKKLFQVKRILAMALAAVMTVTSLPATAHAAEPGDPQTAVEASAEDVSAQDETQDPEAGDAQQTEADAAQISETGDAQQTEADGAQTSETGDAQQTEADGAQTSETGDAQQTGDTQQPAAQAELGESCFEKTEGEALEAEYTVSGDGTPVSPVADESGKKLSAGFLGNFYITVNNEEPSAWLSNTADAIVATVTYQWFAGDTALGEAKKLTEEGALPVDAGTYKLRLVLPEKADTYKGATADYTYEITKSSVTVAVGDPEAVSVGTKAKDVPAPEISSVSAGNGKNFTYVKDDPETTDNEAANNELKLNIVVKDAATGVSLEAEDALVKDGEYVISITPEFIGAKKAEYDKNYSFTHCEDVKLTIGELKETRLTLTPNASYNAKQAVATADDRALHIIEAAAFTESLQNLKYTSAVEEKDGQDAQGKNKWKAVTVKEEELTGAWYTTASYGGTWTEKDKTYCNLTLGSKMDAAPVNAGAYVYRVSYAGDQKVYAASYADIVVVVDVKEIVVKPVVPDGTKFYDGQSVYDVLSQIDYNLFETDGTTAYEKKDNMWGTSYVPSGKTQPYKPDFKLVEITKDKDGKETGRNTYTTSSNSNNQNLKDAVLSKTNEYLVYFSGYKNVYTANGNISDRKGINARVDSMDPDTCGFKVKDDPETLETYFCSLTVDEKNKAVDVSAIEAAAKDKGKMTQEKVGALDNAFTKTYNGAAIFDLHADYKLAKLTSGESDPVKNFTYTWSKSQYSVGDLLEEEPANPAEPDGAKVPTVSKEDLENGNWYGVYSVSPVNAGVYRLRVVYKNSRTQGFADPVDLYFVIKKQKAVLKYASTEALVGNVGNYTSTFVSNYRQKLAEGTALVPELEQPTKEADWKNSELVADGEYQYTYTVNWKLEKKVKNADDSVDWDPVYSLANTTDEYSLAASIQYMTESNNFDVDTKDVRIPITVKAMGANDIKFDGITTADGSVITKKKTYDAESVYALIKDELAKCNKPVIVKSGADGNETKEAVNLTGAPYGIVYKVKWSDIYDYDTYSKTYEGSLPTEEADWAWATKAGTYEISASFGGNENYAPLYSYDAMLADITVEQKELIITVPALEKEFEAGQTAGDVISAARTAFMELAEVVKPADGAAGDSLKADMAKWFTVTEKNGSSGFLAWYYDYDDYGYFSVPYMRVYDTVDDETLDRDDGILQGAGDQRYRLRIDAYDASSTAECWNNYTVSKTDPAQDTPIKVVRGASAVAMNEYSTNKKVDISDEVTVPEKVTGSIVKEHTVRILDGISYYNPSSSNQEGNLVKVEITAPAEYDSIDWTKVYYKQAIKNAAKDRLIEDITTYSVWRNNHTEFGISFTYDATKRDGEEQKDLDFSISWEEGYSERFVFQFSTAVLLGNLMEAAEPKSLAFNAPQTTMVVGQEQQLDVKITKVQNADIICLGYEVTDGKAETMHVDEFGKVTALKAGKATVEVFPMHLVNGKKERLGTKFAKATITVKEVSAPKVTKVVAKNSSLNVQYTLPNEDDGYRREIYVVEGKNVNANAIKGMVEGMKNEQWQGTFAVAPEFLDRSDELNYRIYDYKKAADTTTVSVWIDDLQPNTEYTIYVRNVSAMRSFADGCKVTLSAAGTAKGGKTALKSVDDITAQLTEDENVKLTYIEGSSLEDLDTPEEIQDAIRNADEVVYEVPLTAKNAQISLEGLFTDAAGDVAAPARDYVPLPLAGANLQALKSNFAAPKMAYYFYDSIYEGNDAYDGTPRFEENGYTKTSNIATIANNGKVTLKQPGWVTIVAIDTVSGAESNQLTVHVTAEADSMKGKGASMQVGQTLRLERLVEYKQGNVVLNQNNYSIYGRIDVKAAQESLKQVDTNECFGISDDGYLTAFGKTTKPLEIKLKDKKLNAEVTVKISAKDLEAVKGLKTANVIDNRFDVQFEMNPYAEAYRIEVRDAAKKTIRSIYVENIPHAGGEWNDYWKTWNDDDWGSNSWQGFSDPYHQSEHYVSRNNNLCRADKEKGKWILTYRINRLTQASKYEIEVTTLYGEAFSPKTAKKAVSTTKLPVCDDLYTNKKDDGGLRLTRTTFVSGNTYSINVADGTGIGYAYHDKARIAGTDTLTWTSLDKKVVSVQATSGGFSASLKALKPGTAVIELKSKVLKGVVARRTVTVYAVGDAYNNRDYYGDNENLRGESTWKPGVVTELKVGVAEPVELSGGQSKKFRITLTETGKYSAYKIPQTGGNGSLIGAEYDKYNAGEVTITYTVSGPFTGSVIVKKTGESSSSADAFKNRKQISLNEEFTSQYGAWYVFTAPEDGLYGFKSGSYTQNNAVTVYKQSADGEANTTDAISYYYFFELKKDELVYLKANYESSLRLVKDPFETLTPDSSVTVSAGSEKWFAFTPAEKDVYELKYPSPLECSVYDETLGMTNAYEYYDGQYDESGEYIYTCGYALDKKCIIYMNNYSGVNKTVQFIKRNAYQKFGEDGTYTVTNWKFRGYADYLYLTYKVPADGSYTFSYETTDSNISGSANLFKGNSNSGLNYMSISGSSGQMSAQTLSKDDEVYLRLCDTSYSYPATWETVKFTVTKNDTP